jgi:tetratricopeptide (TPR) repeat protein
VNDYANLEDLRYCAADMQSMEQHLVDVGFDQEQVFVVHSGHDDTKYQPFRANIEKQLDMVLGFVEPDDLVLVAFSGHGVHVDGKTYLCPTEADVDRPDTLVAVDDVYQKLQKCRASLKLLIVDACRNDPRPPGRRSATPKQDLTRLGQSFQQPPQGIVLLASCAPGEISMESEEFGRGVFMNYLLESFTGSADRDKDGRISLGEAAEYAGLKTKLYVARKYNDSQRPYLTGDTTIEALAYAIATRLPLPTPIVLELPQPPVVRADPVLEAKIALYTEKIHINPNNATAYNERGLLWDTKGEYEKAIADYTEALRIEPNTAAYFNNLGTVWQVKGEHQKALANFAEAIRLDPKTALRYAHRANTWRAMGHYEYALLDVNYAIRLDPNYADAYAGRGNAWYDKDDYDKAIADFDQAIRLKPKVAVYYRNRGKSYFKHGSFNRAIADYNEAIRLDPSNEWGYARLAYLRATCPDERFRDGPAALELAKKAYELDGGKEAHPLSALAAAYAELGQFDQAVAFETKAVDLETFVKSKAEARERLAVYQSGKPWREPVVGSDSDVSKSE